MQRLDHRLELRHLTNPGPPDRPRHLTAGAVPGADRGGVGGVRREVPDRVVTPVVGEPPLEQEVVGHVLVYGHQFHRGHAEPRQVLDARLVAEPGVGPPQLGGYARMPHGEALDVELVDDRVRVIALQPDIGTPVERPVRDQAERHVAGRVERARGVVVSPVVVEHLRPEPDLAARRPRIGIDQELGRIAAQALGGVVGTVYPVPVGLPGPHPGDEPVPDAGVVVTQVEAGLGPSRVEQADLCPVGDAGRHREVGPAVAWRRPPGRRPARKCVGHPSYVTDHGRPRPRGGGPVFPPAPVIIWPNGTTCLPQDTYLRSGAVP